MRSLLALFIPLFLLPQAAFSQEAEGSNKLVISLLPVKARYSYQVKVETESGAVFACPKEVSKQVSCVLDGIPAGRVKISAEGKRKVVQMFDLPAGESTLKIGHTYRGLFIGSGLGMLASGGISLAFLLSAPADVLVVPVAALGIGVAYATTGLVLPAEAVYLNGKRVKGNYVKEEMKRGSSAPVTTASPQGDAPSEASAKR